MTVYRSSEFLFVCFIWVLRHFQQSFNHIEVSLDVAGSSMLTFRVLPH